MRLKKTAETRFTIKQACFEKHVEVIMPLTSHETGLPRIVDDIRGTVNAIRLTRADVSSEKLQRTIQLRGLPGYNGLLQAIMDSNDEHANTLVGEMQDQIDNPRTLATPSTHFIKQAHFAVLDALVAALSRLTQAAKTAKLTLNLAIFTNVPNKLSSKNSNIKTAYDKRDYGISMLNLDR